ncbi:MAG: phosphodiester glycosidase family protein [Gemmatimonadaceae bacterium]|nr:phosphodiester glycosidase family protein [Gemmatimonadaceae bacterium]
MIGSAVLALAVPGLLWQPVRPGVWEREMPMAPRGPLAEVRVVALRFDPAQVRFSLQDVTRDYGLRGAWNVDSMPGSATAAFNAGQFIGGSPWGWLVRDGVEAQAPGTGSLGMAFVVDAAGRSALVMPGELAGVRPRAHVAFQSYPALLVDGKLPWELRAAGRGVNLTHRDSRLAIGIMADGSVIVALTRFDGLGKAAETLPWGPTATEMAAFMKSLGCVRAMLLDGGISSQMAVRRADGTLGRWSNWRNVPLALIVSPRDTHASR